jgi:hypothetical protein
MQMVPTERPKDLAKVAVFYRKAADKGDVAAQFNLGIMYDHGMGVPQDYAQAVLWYRKAAEQGFASAQYNLGVAYHEGQGVPQDYVQAAAWYRKAADQGDAAAQFNLGAAYFHGQGVPQDFAEAYSWLNRLVLAQPEGIDLNDVIRLRDDAASHLTDVDLAHLPPPPPPKPASVRAATQNPNVVRVIQWDITIPPECVCCTQPETRRTPIFFQYTTWFLVWAQHRQLSLDLPYCPKCLAHAKALDCPSGLIYLWVIGVMSFVMALLMCCISLSGRNLPQILQLLMSILAIVLIISAISSPILWWQLWYKKKRRAYARTLMGPTCCTEGHAAKFVAHSVLLFENRLFAEHLRSANRNGQLI